MRTHEENESFKTVPREPINCVSLSLENLSYDGDSQRLPTEGTTEGMVIWIAKDSESKPEEYLAECNTHQNGE